MSKKLVALAVGAHADDIEFMMAGTLILLGRAGVELHICNLANGCFGSEVYSKEETARIRAVEAQSAARVAGAVWHPPYFDDLGIYYNAPSVAKVTSLIREVQPDIMLTLSRYDYMEDHEYASRLACSAAFNRCMPNYVSDPPVAAYNKPVAIYHALPHSLMDMQRRVIIPEFVVDIGEAVDQKCEMLGQHVSQKEWLDATQGMDSYLINMKESACEVAARYGRCTYAEGWRRHNYMGYCEADYAPLERVLGDLVQWLE